MSRTIQAGGKTYKPGEFVCEWCKTPLVLDTYYTIDGKNVCQSCRNKERCASCGFLITETKYVTLDDKTYHPDCFRCSECLIELTGKFFFEDNALFCGECINLRDAGPNEELCPKCYLPLSGGIIKALGKRYHEDCFVCHCCFSDFPNDEFVNVKGNPYCDTCIDNESYLTSTAHLKATGANPATGARAGSGSGVPGGNTSDYGSGSGSGSGYGADRSAPGSGSGSGSGYGSGVPGGSTSDYGSGSGYGADKSAPGSGSGSGYGSGVPGGNTSDYGSGSGYGADRSAPGSGSGSGYGSGVPGGNTSDYGSGSGSGSGYGADRSAPGSGSGSGHASGAPGSGSNANRSAGSGVVPETKSVSAPDDEYATVVKNEYLNPASLPPKGVSKYDQQKKFKYGGGMKEEKRKKDYKSKAALGMGYEADHLKDMEGLGYKTVRRKNI